MKEPLYIQVKNDITDKIANLFWKIDSQIPTESELMEIYKVGRETIRKAVAMLVQEGILYRKRGIGTFVRRNSPSLTLEPLISLSALMRTKGHEERSEVIEKSKITVDEKINQLTRIPLGQEIFYVKRKRYIDNMVIAIEESYFIWEEDVESYDFSESITNFLLGYRGVKLEKLEQVFKKKQPTDEHKQTLAIKDDQNVIELERWTYIEDIDYAYFYVNLTILSKIYQLTFF